MRRNLDVTEKQQRPAKCPVPFAKILSQFHEDGPANGKKPSSNSE
jgi:hypothetical protein